MGRKIDEQTYPADMNDERKQPDGIGHDKPKPSKDEREGVEKENDVDSSNR